MFEQQCPKALKPVAEVPGVAFRGIITNHAEMFKVFHLIERVAETRSTVLILGESGTGKELVARAVHELSGRRGTFVPVNCGAIPDNLLESELFGYEKGAFTGALNAKPGRFVLADGGTVFLDEIGEMSPHLQVKLLRVLQERIVEPVGGVKSKPVDIRLIAATNADLKESVRRGTMREDLFYRLQVVPIDLPPLRIRATDIPVLIRHFAERCAREHSRCPLIFSDEAMEQLLSYSWPGNVRELENLTERLSILIDRDVIYPADLPVQFNRTFSTSPGGAPVLPEEGIDFNTAVEHFENSLILQALHRTSGNKKAAARLLKLNRTTLVEKIKKKGLGGETDDSELRDLTPDHP